ncbi:LOG family protein [Trichothermofontia sp.]
MASLPPNDAALATEVANLVAQLPHLKHGQLIRQALSTLVRLAEGEIDRLDWKILASTLQDMERATQAFSAYRHVRKVTIFGSARLRSDSPEYQQAVDFARCITQQGFMVITGAGGGIMEAGNAGAGPENSFGLNIRLPFEQKANPYIDGDSKLVTFKYFFVRKLFLLKESDAVALFPGGFGTQDEAFECLTLSQTGKFGPVPMVLIDRPGGTYWQAWNAYIEEHLLKSGLISPDDPSVYTITDRLDVACQTIADFYRVYHSCRYVGDLLVIRLKHELLDADVAQLNRDFSDILVKGTIQKCPTLLEEAGDETVDLPRISLYFNQQDLGRLHQLILRLNQLGAAYPEAHHPEQK